MGPLPLLDHITPADMPLVDRVARFFHVDHRPQACAMPQCVVYCTRTSLRHAGMRSTEHTGAWSVATSAPAPACIPQYTKRSGGKKASSRSRCWIQFTVSINLMGPRGLYVVLVVLWDCLLPTQIGRAAAAACAQKDTQRQRQSRHHLVWQAAGRRLRRGAAIPHPTIESVDIVDPAHR